MIDLPSIQYFTAMAGQWSPVLHALDRDLPAGNPLVEEFRERLLENAREGIKLPETSLKPRLDLPKPVCRYFTPLATFCSLHICDAVARWSLDDTQRNGAALLCCKILNYNRVGFKICGPLMQMFRTTIDDYGMDDIADELEELYGTRNQHSVDEILDACTRLSYTIPVGQITRWLDPSFQAQWTDEWKREMGGSQRHQSTASHTVRLEDIMN